MCAGVLLSLSLSLSLTNVLYYSVLSHQHANYWTCYSVILFWYLKFLWQGHRKSCVVRVITFALPIFLHRPAAMCLLYEQSLIKSAITAAVFSCCLRILLSFGDSHMKMVYSNETLLSLTGWQNGRQFPHFNFRWRYLNATIKHTNN